MCCEQKGHHHGSRHGTHHHAGACDCGCGTFHFGRRFWTKDEKISRFEQYLEDLRQEAQAVEERVAAMKAG